MRRWPFVRHPKLIPQGMTGTPQPSQVGNIIEPFLASGGAVAYQVAAGPPIFDPRPAGFQLVAYMYVPNGRAGFVKQLRVAPFVPAALVDPFQESGIDNLNTSFSAFNPSAHNGVWETPFAWEGYFDVTDPPTPPPLWRWHLRFLQGDLGKLREKRPAFNVAVPASWYLVPDIAVPASTYSSGLPGSTPSGYWRPQRLQVIQSDELTTHVVVPSDHTICLFTEWRQDLVQPRGRIAGSEGETTYFDRIYPLLPSFGQLHGYMQAADREVSTINAQHGWGG